MRGLESRILQFVKEVTKLMENALGYFPYILKSHALYHAKPKRLKEST